jgi:hypothetical protein
MISERVEEQILVRVKRQTQTWGDGGERYATAVPRSRKALHALDECLRAMPNVKRVSIAAPEDCMGGCGFGGFISFHIKLHVKLQFSSATVVGGRWRKLLETLLAERVTRGECKARVLNTYLGHAGMFVGRKRSNFAAKSRSITITLSVTVWDSSEN